MRQIFRQVIAAVLIVTFTLPIASVAAAEKSKVIIAIDVSGSMRGEALERSITAANRLLNSLSADTDFQIYLFARQLRALDSKLLQEINQTGVVPKLEGAGYTSLYDAAWQLIRLARPSGSPVIILTDGKDSRSMLTASQLLTRLEDPLDSLNFIGYQLLPEDANALSELAEKTGGRLYGVENAAQLGTTLRLALSTLTKEELPMPMTPLFAIASAVTLLAFGFLMMASRWRDRERFLDAWSEHLQAFDKGTEDESSLNRDQLNTKNLIAQYLGDTTLIFPKIADTRVRELLTTLSGFIVMTAFLFLGVPIISAFLLALIWVGSGIKFLANRATVRLRTSFENELPGTLKLLASSLTAGLSFLQALDSFASESTTVVAREFRRALTEIQMGSPIERALGNIADRMESDDLRWVVFAFSVQREVGGSLARILRTSAETIESRANVRQEVRTLSAEGRISSYVLMLLPFGIFIFLAVTRPEFISLFWREAIGRYLIGIVAVLITLSWLWMRRLIKVQV